VRRKEFLTMVAPSVLLMGVLLMAPLIQTLWWSMQKVTYGSPGQWTGLANYEAVIGDSRFRDAVLFTVSFTLAAVCVKVILGYALALLLNASGRWRPVFLGLLLVSYIVPTVIGATAFSWLFDTNFGGVVNFVLDKFGLNEVLWFSDQWPARLMLFANAIWHELPFAVLILLAGLQGVQTDPMEAASIDGASWLQKQRYVVIPSLAGLFGFIALISIMDGLRMFDALIPLMPDAIGLQSESIMLYIYNIAFAAGTQDLGLGSAVSVLTMVIILVLLTPFIRQTYREVRRA
jgi:ABC-type sugar transport system permease subunit